MSVHGYETKKGKRWAVVVYQDGKQVWRRGFTSSAKAKTEERRLLSKRDEGLDLNPERLTVEAYAARWLASRKGRIKDSTWRTYEQVFRTQITPFLGPQRIVTLRPEHVDRYIHQLEAHGLSASTIATARRVLGTALGQAVAWGLVYRNAAQRIETPTVKRRDLQMPTDEELRNLRDAADASPFGPLIILALASGLRLGELLALEWQDVTFEEEGALLSVRASKTRAGVRSLHVGADATQVLRERRGIGGNVFPWRWWQAEYGWKQIRKAAGLQRLRFHDLRHISVSLLIEQGVDFKTIQERVGHSSIQVTLDVYGHLRPRSDREAAAALDRILAKH